MKTKKFVLNKTTVANLNLNLKDIRAGEKTPDSDPCCCGGSENPSRSFDITNCCVTLDCD